MCAFSQLTDPLGAQTDDNRATRKYSDGPLTAEDFKAPVPDDVADQGLSAQTLTEIRYAYRYETVGRNGEVTMTLTVIDVHAVLLQDQCWNRSKQDRALLDHEQGHFDITEIHARQAQREFEELIKGDGIRATADSRRLALVALRKAVDDIASPYIERSKQEHVRYDQLTEHGRRREAQAEYRRTQKEQLESLDEDS